MTHNAPSDEESPPFDPTRPVMCRDGTPAIITEIGPNYIKARGMCIQPDGEMTFRRDTGRFNLHSEQNLHLDLVNAPPPRKDHRIMLDVPEVATTVGPDLKLALVQHLRAKGAR